ncbi:MAG: hypothetical protein ACRCXT_24170 [Paraclostridium sp.]
MNKYYKKPNYWQEESNNMQYNLQPSMPINNNCGCGNAMNNCEECYKYENMANHKRNQARQLQEQARNMQMEADALMREAHMLMCRAEECFKQYNNNHNHDCNHNHTCNHDCECSHEHECNHNCGYNHINNCNFGSNKDC